MRFEGAQHLIAVLASHSLACAPTWRPKIKENIWHGCKSDFSFLKNTQRSFLIFYVRRKSRKFNALYFKHKWYLSSWKRVKTTLERSDLKSEKRSDFRLNWTCPVFKWITKELFWILLPATCIVFKTNQNRSCNGSFESRSFSQACAVRNEHSRHEIGEKIYF